MKRKGNIKLSRVLKKDGAFLLEAMIGTAILSIVLVFFATVSMSAYMLMQKAYHETQIAEEVFLKVESRRYAELLSEQSSLPIAGGNELVLGLRSDSETGVIDDEYIEYIAADGTVGTLNSMQITDFSKELFSSDLYTFRYHISNDDYQAVFYILKGEK